MANDFRVDDVNLKDPIGFGGEKAIKAQATLDMGFYPSGYFKGQEKSGKISKKYANFIDNQKKKKK